MLEVTLVTLNLDMAIGIFKELTLSTEALLTKTQTNYATDCPL